MIIIRPITIIIRDTLKFEVPILHTANDVAPWLVGLTYKWLDEFHEPVGVVGILRAFSIFGSIDRA